MRLFVSTFCALVSLVSGCGASNIPNTDVPDNAENREVIQFVERYRNALEAREPATVLALVSRQYFDDNGTPSGADDMDYGELREALLHLRERVTAIRYEIRYRRITFRDTETPCPSASPSQDLDSDAAHDGASTSACGTRVFVDYTYTGNFRVTAADGEHWSRRLSDNRVTLARQNGEFTIVSGL